MARFFLFFLLILLPVVSGFNCDYFQSSQKADCFTIDSSNLTAAEKDTLYAGLLYGSSTTPNFEIIRNWNLAQSLVKSDSAKTAEGQFVKNAWLDQMALMPSVMDNNTLYVPNNIEVLTGSGYNLVIPPNYRGNYPSASQGDCRRDYSLTSNSAKTEVFVNGDKEGEGNLVNARINRDSAIESKFTISVDVEIDHYKWNKYCCKRTKDGCSKYCYTCKFNRKEAQSDRIELNDVSEVKLYSQMPEVNFQVNEDYYGTTKGTVQANNDIQFKLIFENSYIVQSSKVFKVVFSSKPNYIATLEAIPSVQQEIRNLLLNNNTFYVKNTDECKIITQTYFEQYIQYCDLTPRQEARNDIYTEVIPVSADIVIAFQICIFQLIVYTIFRIIRHYWGDWV